LALSCRGKIARKVAHEIKLLTASGALATLTSQHAHDASTTTRLKKVHNCLDACLQDGPDAIALDKTGEHLHCRRHYVAATCVGTSSSITSGTCAGISSSTTRVTTRISWWRWGRRYYAMSAPTVMLLLATTLSDLTLSWTLPAVLAASRRGSRS